MGQACFGVIFFSTVFMIERLRVAPSSVLSYTSLQHSKLIRRVLNHSNNNFQIDFQNVYLHPSTHAIDPGLHHRKVVHHQVMVLGFFQRATPAPSPPIPVGEDDEYYPFGAQEQARALSAPRRHPCQSNMLRARPWPDRGSQMGRAQKYNDHKQPRLRGEEENGPHGPQLGISFLFLPYSLYLLNSLFPPLTLLIVAFTPSSRPPSGVLPALLFGDRLPSTH